jgi:hypothetical protein
MPQIPNGSVLMLSMSFANADSSPCFKTFFALAAATIGTRQAPGAGQTAQRFVFQGIASNGVRLLFCAEMQISAKTSESAQFSADRNQVEKPASFSHHFFNDL